MNKAKLVREGIELFLKYRDIRGFTEKNALGRAVQDYFDEKDTEDTSFLDIVICLENALDQTHLTREGRNDYIKEALFIARQRWEDK